MYSGGPEKKPSSADWSDVSGSDVLPSAVGSFLRNSRHCGTVTKLGVAGSAVNIALPNSHRTKICGDLSLLSSKQWVSPVLAGVCEPHSLIEIRVEFRVWLLVSDFDRT